MSTTTTPMPTTTLAPTTPGGPLAFPLLVSQFAFKYPVRRSVSQRTTVHVFSDFSEQRYACGTPLTSFELNYNRISSADLATLRTFYTNVNGTASTFSLSFEGNAYAACQFVGPFDAQLVGPQFWTVSLKVRSVNGTQADPIPAGMPGATTTPAPTTTRP